ncbi:hypothetical protein [Nonomuraea sp. NPDC048826]|uniref:hypothetical protein n=1 Tax=Nonomuraea sp. NPDC048826 TaxID=3364347 RepID=UPI003719470C
MTGTWGARIGRGTLYGLLGTWFALSFVKQDPTRKLKLDWIDKIDGNGMLLPDWRFFAPNPGMWDNHLLYRDELDDGTVTPWKEVLSTSDRFWLHILWYPDRRDEKALFDLVGQIARTVVDPEFTRPRDIQVTTPYLLLLNYVIHRQPHHRHAKNTQFFISRSTGRDDSEQPLALFLSNVHPLS